MKISTYNSLLTKKRTWIIVSIGNCGYNDYVEAQIKYSNGSLSYSVTDGYKDLFELTCPKTTSLKELMIVLPSMLKAVSIVKNNN